MYSEAYRVKGLMKFKLFFQAIEKIFEMMNANTVSPWRSALVNTAIKPERTSKISDIFVPKVVRRLLGMIKLCM
jgi:hypothetical protein